MNKLQKILIGILILEFIFINIGFWIQYFDIKELKEDLADMVEQSNYYQRKYLEGLGFMVIDLNDIPELENATVITNMTLELYTKPMQNDYEMEGIL